MVAAAQRAHLGSRQGLMLHVADETRDVGVGGWSVGERGAL